MTDDVTEMPRSFSIDIQSESACREALRAFTAPASWMAPPNSSSFSVSVVLPASGWLMMPNVRRRSISFNNCLLNIVLYPALAVVLEPFQECRLLTNNSLAVNRQERLPDVYP